MNPRYVFMLAVVLAAAAFVLRYTLWRALLFLSPTAMKVDAEDPGAAKAPPDALKKTARELALLGFAPLGTHSERPPLGPQKLCWNYQHTEDATLATLYETRGGEAHLYFLSVLAGGGLALSASYRRPAREVPGRYLSGYLEDVSAERLYKAHLRRLMGVETERRPLTLDARVELQRAWYGGPGKSEVRQQHFRGLLWTLGTLGMVAAAIFAGA